MTRLTFVVRSLKYDKEGAHIEFDQGRIGDTDEFMGRGGELHVVGLRMPVGDFVPGKLVTIDIEDAHEDDEP